MNYMSQEQKFEEAVRLATEQERDVVVAKDMLIEAINDNAPVDVVRNLMQQWEREERRLAKFMLNMEERRILRDVRNGKLILVSTETGKPASVFTVDLNK